MAPTLAPPRRGVPYYDVARGMKMIVPREGGKAIPYVGARSEWNPRAALRRAGIRATAAGDRAARRAPSTAARAVRRADALPNLGGAPLGVGGLIVYVFVSILALALLENVLSGRGPVTVSRLLDFLGGGIARLVNPNDPLVRQGAIAATSPTTSSGAGSFGTATLTKTVTNVGGVRFTGKPLTGVKTGFVDAIASAAKDAGATLVDVISGVRSPEANAAAGGVPGSNHLTGDALDARAFIPGKGWVPLGTLTTLSAYGIRSGNQPGFYNGRPDPNHVDTGANQ